MAVATQNRTNHKVKTKLSEYDQVQKSEANSCKDAKTLKKSCCRPL